MAARAARRLADTVSRNLVDDINRCSFIKQSGVSLKYMMDFGSYPSDKNLLLSSRFLHKELPIRLAHRVTELEDLPYGLSSKAPVLKVRFLTLELANWVLGEISDCLWMFTLVLQHMRCRKSSFLPLSASFWTLDKLGHFSIVKSMRYLYCAALVSKHISV